MSEDEFFAWCEQNPDEKYELVNGEIIAMAGLRAIIFKFAKISLVLLTIIWKRQNAARIPAIFTLKPQMKNCICPM